MGNDNTFINILLLLIKQINTLILYVQGVKLGYVQDRFLNEYVKNSTLVSLQAFIGLLVFWGGFIFFNSGLPLLSFLYSFNYGSGIEQGASSTPNK